MKRNYFEGWYFKHCYKEEIFAVIPGIHIENKKKAAFIQVIMRDKSYYIPYRYEQFYCDPNKFYVVIGKNIFSSEGIHLEIETKELRLAGDLRYEKLRPLVSDIMGPFRYIPGMECRHGVISMEHSIFGSLIYNGSYQEYTGGRGYIEKDQGTSFPKEYVWSQCNVFPKKKLNIMAAAARIPIGCFEFPGCLSVVQYCGEEYRLATYNGARVRKIAVDGMVLAQRNLRLEIKLYKSNEQLLRAPVRGQMSQKIYEDMEAEVAYKFHKDGKLLFHEISRKASFEYARRN